MTDTITVGAARAAYFLRNRFSEADYRQRWVRFRVGPIPIRFPNVPARVATVKLHDLHHVATGYDTTVRGEAQIAAWELAAGCGRHWVAWLLNLGAVGIGVWLAPIRVWRAFARGRQSRTLYHREFADDLLAMTVRDLRAQLALRD